MEVQDLVMTGYFYITSGIYIKILNNIGINFLFVHFN